MKMLANELLKIKRSKSVKVLFLVFLFFIILCTLLGENTGSDLMRSGFSGPFMWNGMMGASGLFAYGAIAAGLVASEFDLGVVRNAIGCGVTKTRYFVVKTISVLIVSAIMYLVCTCLFTVTMTMKYGFDPKGLIPSDYWTKAVVFNLAALTVQLSCVAMYICFAHIFRAASVTFVASVAVSFIELFLTAPSIKSSGFTGDKFYGSLNTMWILSDHFTTDTILTEEFILLAVPCAFILVVSLLVSYIIFMKRGV